MKLYNRLMEIFWFVMGVAILVFAGYLYINDITDENLRYYFMAGSMAIILSVFRMIFRKHGSEKLNNPKK